MPLPDRFDQVVQSWDLAFKDLATSDYVVAQVWAAAGAARFLLDQHRELLISDQHFFAIAVPVIGALDAFDYVSKASFRMAIWHTSARH